MIVYKICTSILLAPVNSTVPSTSPLTTVDPILQLHPENIVTGSDSPVKAASSTSISPSFILQSAGMADPEASSTRSPEEWILII